VRKTAKERLAEREARARSELLDSLFEAWIGGVDKAEVLARLGPVDPQAPPAVMRALQTDILPAFTELTAETQGRIRKAVGVLALGDRAEFRVYWLELRAPFGTSEADADAIFPVVARLLGVRLPETDNEG
jgi:hypothetical protein